jgi:hypothetical protein
MSGFALLDVITQVIVGLRANGALMSAVSNRIYDVPPQGSSFPLVALADPQAIDYSAKTWAGQDITLSVNAWSDYEGRLELLTLAALIFDTLHLAVLPTTTHQTFLCRVVSQSFATDGDGSTRKLTTTVRILSAAIPADPTPTDGLRIVYIDDPRITRLGDYRSYQVVVPPPTPLVDQALWIGSWDFAGDVGDSVVSGLPPFNAIFSQYPTLLAPIISGEVNGDLTNESARCMNGSVDLIGSQFSFAGFIYQDSASAHLLHFGIGINVSTIPTSHTVQEVLRIHTDGTILKDGANIQAFTPIYGATYHACATYDGVTVSIYINGALEYSGTPPLNNPYDMDFVFPNVYYGFGSGAPLRKLDNFVVHKSVFSQAAIDALAAGHMPDSTGVLI